MTFPRLLCPNSYVSPLFSPFKILKGVLPGRCLPVRGVLSCARGTSCFIVPREGFNRFLLVVSRHPKHQKTNACPEKGLLAQCLPVACPLPPSCLPASLGPAKMVWNALGRGSKGGEKVGEGANAIPTGRPRTPSSQAFVYLSQLPWKETEPHTLMKTGTAFCKS